MKNIILLNPPCEQIVLRDQYCSSLAKADYYWPPIDLLILSGIISKEYNVYVVDAVINRLSEVACIEKVVGYNADVVIFLTGNKSFVSDFDFCKKIKQYSCCKLIALGDIVLYEPEYILNTFKYIDAIILDFTSEAILDYLKGNTEDIAGMCYREQDNIVLKHSLKKNTFSIPVPRHDMFDLEKYSIPHGTEKVFSSVLTNYGCPYQCKYCVAEKIRFKYRPVENIIPELELLTAMGVKEIFFKDFTFGIPRDVALNLCKLMVNKFPHFSWIASSRVDVVDEKLLRIMKEAGCHTIQFGVESASQAILDKSKKQIGIEQVINIFELCNKFGIRTLAHFILGLPGETEETIRETVKLAKTIKCDFASFNMAYPIHGTTLREECLKNGFIKGEEDIINTGRDYPVIETELLSRSNLKKLKNYAVRSFYFRPAYIIRKLKGVRSFYDISTLFKQGIGILFSLRRKN